MRRNTRRFIITSLDNLNLSSPYRYERYYINDTLRIQKKEDKYIKEILDDENNIIEKLQISEKEFLEIKKDAYAEIIRNGYDYLDDKRVSLREYLGKHAGFIRVEVEFESEKEKENYVKPKWMGAEITNSPLAFDKDLSKLNLEEFKAELEKHCKL